MPNKNSTENALFDVEQIEKEQVSNNGYLSEQTQFMMLEMMKMGCNKSAISMLLEMAGISREWIKYLEGPVVCHGNDWMDTIPAWLINACYVERLERIFEELKQGEVGTMATPAEVLACIYPASMQAPMHSNWSDVYFWCGATVMPRHRPGWCKTPQDFWNHLGSEEISYRRIQHDYEYIARDIRQKVLAHAPKAAKTPRTPAKGKSASLEMPDLEPSPATSEPEAETLQVNLFDLI